MKLTVLTMNKLRGRLGEFLVEMGTFLIESNWNKKSYEPYRLENLAVGPCLNPPGNKSERSCESNVYRAVFWNGLELIGEKLMEKLPNEIVMDNETYRLSREESESQLGMYEKVAK